MAFFIGALACAELPPIIDREAFFGEIEIAGAQISPDGKFVSFLKPYKGVRNIWVKQTDEPFSAARPMTAETKRPLAGYFWTRDSRYLLFTKDNDGDENFNIYSVDPAAPPAESTGVPPARDLTGVKGARVVIYALPKTQPDT
ncbi:MAG: S9 family peptidase, partial [Bryobacteraceae bacterium]|nr:S9 family peptidase [Bryobacteraceae bacterium]